MNESSPRAQYSIEVLKRVGFTVKIFHPIPDTDMVLSNKKSMMCIYEMIVHGDDEWVYVFEDDINTLCDIRLDEIIQYESISIMFFYLGLCDYGPAKTKNHFQQINNHPITIVDGFTRGLHAIGLSKKGATQLLEYSKSSPNRYMDMCLEQFSEKYPANVVRYDLESYIPGHRGVFFQDRNRFPSIIST